jgi:hypothetical protein
MRRRGGFGRRSREGLKGSFKAGCARIDWSGKRGRSFTVKLLPLRSGFVGGNYLCGSPKERWLRTARLEPNMARLNVGRHTLKPLSTWKSLCNWRLRELPVAALLGYSKIPSWTAIAS